LEVIIVIIIVGVLASLALPRFFKMIESSRSVEGIYMLKVWRDAIERCYMQTRDYMQCKTFNVLAIEDPTKAPGSHFDNPTMGSGISDYSIGIFRNNLDLIVTDPGGALVCSNYKSSNPQSQLAICVTNKIEVVGSGFYKGL